MKTLLLVRGAGTGPRKGWGYAREKTQAIIQRYGITQFICALLNWMYRVIRAACEVSGLISASSQYPPCEEREPSRATAVMSTPSVDLL